MQALDLAFIEEANGPTMVVELENLSRAFNFDLSELKKSGGFSESTFTRWASSKRHPRRSSRMKIRSFIESFVS